MVQLFNCWVIRQRPLSTITIKQLNHRTSLVNSVSVWMTPTEKVTSRSSGGRAGRSKARKAGGVLTAGCGGGKPRTGPCAGRGGRSALRGRGQRRRRYPAHSGTVCHSKQLSKGGKGEYGRGACRPKSGGRRRTVGKADKSHSGSGGRLVVFQGIPYVEGLPGCNAQSR